MAELLRFSAILIIFDIEIFSEQTLFMLKCDYPERSVQMRRKLWQSQNPTKEQNMSWQMP